MMRRVMWFEGLKDETVTCNLSHGWEGMRRGRLILVQWDGERSLGRYLGADVTLTLPRTSTVGNSGLSAESV